MIGDNLKKIYDTIEEIKIKKGITREIALMAVSKTYPASDVAEAYHAGQRLFGENRILEAYDKFNDPLLAGKDIELHIIGHLQRNKAKEAVKVASMIQSIDKIDTLCEIEKQCAKIDKTIGYLIEVNTSFEAAKSGIEPAAVAGFMEAIAKAELSHCKLRGVMTVGPLTGDEVQIRKSFALLRNIFEQIGKTLDDPGFSIISMGMSGDYQLAIEEGSTLLRIGSAIFGRRNYN